MKVLGDYQILKEMGSGPLGTHYAAEHRFLKKPVVLKVLPEDLASDRGFLKRFEELIGALTKLDHPHIVRIHNVSFSEGKYFLVSDFLGSATEGALNLSRFLEIHKEAFKEEELLAIVRGAASALDYLHENKLFHGSLKLSNVLISKEAGKSIVSLADVGISRLFAPGTLLSRISDALMQGLKERDTASGSEPSAFLQDFVFLAPEQKRSHAVDGVRADIYSFGVLVYFLIMRHYPEGFFPLPSHAAPQYKLPWDRLIIQCLQPDPLKRPPSLRAIMEELASEAKESVESKKEEPLKPKIKPQELKRPEFDEDPGAIFQKEYTVAQFRPKPAEVKNLDPILTEMVVIKGGTFYRGSNNGGRDEMPRHEIILDSFAIDVHPVTNEQFVRFLEAMGGEKDAQNNDTIRLRESRIKRSGGKLNIESGYTKHPVVGVTWYGALAYAKWVGKRLPTEAEWEIAAYGSLDEAVYPTGNNIERSQANFFSSDTTTVMSYPPNGLGLYDIAGNVYEWCQDWYGYHYYDESVQEPNNPKGPPQGVYRVLRGGCWKSLKEDLRCSHRHRNNPGTMNGTYGFRCAADVS